MILLEKKISEIKEKLVPIKGTTLAINFNNEIKKKLERVDKETQKKKIKKYRRDYNDFNIGEVYLWQSTTNRAPPVIPFVIDPPSRGH